MRIFLIVILFNVLPVILAELFEFINEDLGSFHFHAKVGNLPLKYVPLSTQDQNASDKAADVMDFIQLVPNIDPLEIQRLQPIGIDLPFLFLSGHVSLKNFVLTGIKQFQVNSIELRLINLRSDLNITIPLIYFEGDVHLQAKFSFIPVVFKCHLSANLFDVDVVATAGGYKINAPPTGEVLQIDGADVKVDLKNVVFNMTDINTSGDLEVIGPVLTQMFSGKDTSDENIFDGLLKTALNMVNQQLLSVSIDVFKEYLLSDSY